MCSQSKTSFILGQPNHCNAEHSNNFSFGVAKSVFTMGKVLWQVTPTLPAFGLAGHSCCRDLASLSAVAVTARRVSGAPCWEQLWPVQP